MSNRRGSRVYSKNSNIRKDFKLTSKEVIQEIFLQIRLDAFKEDHIQKLIDWFLKKNFPKIIGSFLLGDRFFKILGSNPNN